MAGFLVLGLIGLLLAVLCIPFSVRVSYRTGEPAGASLRWLFWKAELGGILERAGAQEQKLWQAHREKARRKRKIGQAGGGPEEFAKTAKILLDLLAAVQGGLGFLLRRFPLRVRLSVVVAEDDAAETAIAYGRLNAAVYGLYAAASNLLRLEKPQVSIRPDFTARQGSVDFLLRGRMTPLAALAGAAGIAGRFLLRVARRAKQERQAAGASAPVE